MSARPEFWGAQYSGRFADPSIIAAYRYRPPYPDALMDRLISLITDEPRAVLDVGCGPGNIARLLLPHVTRVDAIDVSPGMIALGKTLPGGDDPRLRWLVGRAENVPLDPPYALVTAGASLHWMDWEVALPRFADALTPHGQLAIVGVDEWDGEPWTPAIRAIIPRYSTNPDFAPFDLIAELERRMLFATHGEYTTEPVPLVRSVEDFIEWFHSMSSFSRDLMRPEAVVAFDAELRAAVVPYLRDDLLETHSVGRMTWGKPLRKQ
ncbi:MAG: class I SAM-dependent methyltransferase [Thermomicrobiales bacterium]